MSSDEKQKRGRVLLVGMGPTTATALDALAERFAVIGLVREVAGGAVDPVVVRACRLGVRIIPVATIPGIEAAVNELRPDCVVVSSFHRILPDTLLAKCPFLNVHYAMLPRYRGRAGRTGCHRSPPCRLRRRPRATRGARSARRAST